MKKLGVVFLSFLILLIGCNDNKAWEPHSPENTSSLMMQYANQEDYEQFKTLLLKSNKEDSMKQMYDTAVQAVSNSAGIMTFTLVTFKNGKNLLVQLAPESEDGEVLIQDIIEIPEEMVTYIEEELEKRFNR